MIKYQGIYKKRGHWTHKPGCNCYYCNRYKRHYTPEGNSIAGWAIGIGIFLLILIAIGQYMNP